ncbi:MAG: hypothetical protein Q4F52_08680 [Bacteroidaceae bacterium]|nr:hypothetical protein [Bacteroidaceae bacterium]
MFEIFRAVVPSATAKSRKAAETENTRKGKNLNPEFLEHLLIVKIYLQLIESAKAGQNVQKRLKKGAKKAPVGKK